MRDQTRPIRLWLRLVAAAALISAVFAGFELLREVPAEAADASPPQAGRLAIPVQNVDPWSRIF